MSTILVANVCGASVVACYENLAVLLEFDPLFPFLLVFHVCAGHKRKKCPGLSSGGRLNVIAPLKQAGMVVLVKTANEGVERHVESYQIL